MKSKQRTLYQGVYLLIFKNITTQCVTSFWTFLFLKSHQLLFPDMLKLLTNYILQTTKKNETQIHRKIGNASLVYISDPDDVKVTKIRNQNLKFWRNFKAILKKLKIFKKCTHLQIVLNKFSSLGKSSLYKFHADYLGEGLITAPGKRNCGRWM